jgi:hypothetical protein
MIEAKMLNWFDYRRTSIPLHSENQLLIEILKEYQIYQWLRRNTVDRLSSTFGISHSSPQSPSPTETLDGSEAEDVWKERKEAELAIKTYLSDLPSEARLFYT